MIHNEMAPFKKKMTSLQFVNIFCAHKAVILCSVDLSLGSCHHGMACPHVADGGTASDMQGSCEYIE